MKNVIKIILTITLIACGQQNRPQVIDLNLPYTVEEVNFLNHTDGAKLAGTLIIPKKGKTFPAVILVSGSGLQDRDETVYGHKPFKVLSDYLTRNGIAVLRYDERSVGKSKGKLSGVTTLDFAEDAYAGIKLLRNYEQINPNKIGIIGHSEGGLVAAILAERDSTISFIVLLGSPAVPIDEALIYSHKNKLRREGKSEEIIDAGANLLSNLFTQIKKGEGYSTTKKKLTKIIEKWKSSLTGEAKLDIEEFIKENPKWFEYIADEWSTPWWKFLANFDPRDKIRKLRCPVLALIGKKDIQVNADQNLTELKMALEKGGNKNYRIEYLDDINHLFQKCETGFREEYAQLDESFNEDVMKLISDWIHSLK
ncbi:MAG: alpha/beta hydrolase [Candidatus Cloacimonetes bacterium]|nr:alpha/beta hydrolase [Candidatus Cloacimonadota bacterium]